MIDNKVVGQAISLLRQSENMTQQTLAACLNVSHQAVSKWEKGAALPDVLTLMELSRMFGVTLEQLLTGDIGQRLVKETEEAPARKPIELRLDYDDIGVSVEKAVENAESAASAAEEQPPKEADEPKAAEGEIDLDKIIEMAPFMSRAALDEIAMSYRGKCTPRQLAKLAPFLSKECLENLVLNCESEINWDTLRRLAPFLRKEAVDALTAACAKGEKYSNDLGRHIRKGLKEVFTFGEKIYHEAIKPGVKKVIVNDRPERGPGKARATQEQPARDRVSAARCRIFEKALNDERFDWIGEHIDQLDDEALKSRIAARALELGKNEWLAEYMDGYCDQEALDNALLNGNWEYIAANIGSIDDAMLWLIADTAAAEGKWDWLSENIDRICKNHDARSAVILSALQRSEFDWLGDNLESICPTEGDSMLIGEYACAGDGNWEWLEAHIDELRGMWASAEYAENAYKAGYTALAKTIAEDHLSGADLSGLILLAAEADDVEYAAEISQLSSGNTDELCLSIARGGRMNVAIALAEHLETNTIAALLEIAAEQGDWEMIDRLNDMLG